VAKFDVSQTLSATDKTEAGETSVALQLTARF
jgi:hypothetical protein